MGAAPAGRSRVGSNVRRPPAGRERPVRHLLEPSTVLAAFDMVLHSVWLLPVLIFLIALDGPFPVLPSETLLISATTAAFGVADVGAMFGLFVASVVGSMIGDLFVYGLGRSSNRILRGHGRRDEGLSGWVRRNMYGRPLLVFIGARLLPGGRLASTAAAGRVQLPVPTFLTASAASSTVWAGYMLLVGLVLGPITGGNPFLCVLAGIAMAIITGGGFEIARRLLSAHRARRAAREPGVSRPGAICAAPVRTEPTRTGLTRTGPIRTEPVEIPATTSP